MDPRGEKRPPGIHSEKNWLRWSVGIAAIVLVAGCESECSGYRTISPPSFESFSESLDRLYGITDNYLDGVGSKTSAEVRPYTMGGPAVSGDPVFNADFVAYMNGLCLDSSSLPTDADPAGGPSVKGVILSGTPLTENATVNEIVEEFKDLAYGGWHTFTWLGAPLTESGDIAVTYGTFDYSGSLEAVTQGREDVVRVDKCPDPLPPVAYVAEVIDRDPTITTARSTTAGVDVATFEDEDGEGVVVANRYVLGNIERSTRADDEVTRQWYTDSFRKWGFGVPRLDDWAGMEGEDRYSFWVAQVPRAQFVVPFPAFVAPPAPRAGTGGLIERAHSAYGAFQREVDRVIEEGRGSCDYEAGEGVMSTLTKEEVEAYVRGGRDINLKILRDRDGGVVCRDLPVAGALFKGGTSTRSRMWVDVTGGGEAGMAQVPIDVLVDAGKVRERRDGRRGEPVVVEIDRTDGEGQVTVPVDEFDVPEGTETVAFELTRTRRDTLRERRVVLVPLTDDISYEEAERRVGEEYRDWEVTRLDGYLAWGPGGYYSLDLVRRRIRWSGLGIWGELRRRAFMDYLDRTAIGRRGLVLADEFGLMVIAGWLMNPFGFPEARTIPGVQQKLAFLEYVSAGYTVSEGPSAGRAVPGGGLLDSGAGPDGMPEIYLVDRGESTGESMEMVVVNGDGPFRFSGAVVVEPVELGPEARRRLEAAVLDGNGRRVTVQAYCLQRDLRVPAEGMVMRIADRSIQERFAFERRILYAARDARDSDRLHPNTSAESYFHSVLQWAVWTREKGYDREEFEEAFVEHARENFAQAGRAWNQEIERAVRGLVPARWDDVQRILEDAES